MVKTLSGVTNFSVSNNLKINKLTANSSTGSAGQILTSNGTSPYWNDLSITVNAGDGLTGGGSGTNLTLNVGAGSGITVAADSISVNAAYINTIAANSSTYLGGNTAQDLRDYSSNATNLSSGTVAEARLPFRMDQNVRTSDNVQFNNMTVTGNLVVNGTSTVLQGNVVTFTDNMLYLNQGISATITNITSNGTHVIFTANNNYSAGWDVAVSGVNPSSYNGDYNNIFAANATTFTVANTNTASYVSGGTARGKSDANPDLGFAAGYNDGSYAHTGFFRDATDGVWKVFDSYLPEPDLSVFIDTANASFKIANFQANTIYVGNTSVYATINTTSFTGTANNATYFNGYTWAAPAALGGSTANSGSFTTVTTSGNVGIKNSAPTDTLSVNGTSYFGANVTITSALIANSGAGSAGQALFSNGSGTYWATPTDNNTTYDLLAIANTEQNKGIVRLRSSANANDDVYVVGNGGVVVSSNDTSIVITGQFGDITGVNAGDGLTGTAVSGDVTLSVLANTGIVANATGVYVNAAYIATINSNTANFVSNGTTTNTFTVGTASYFVSNGNLGIGTNSPIAKLHVAGNVITGKIKQSPNLIAKILKASDSASGDSYGRSVSISTDGTTMAVGAPNWEGTTGTNRGGVYVYKWNGYSWVQQGDIIQAADAADNDNFGTAVAVSTYGTVLAVGAPNWEGAAGSNRGGVYIYDWNGTSWVQRGSVIEASDAADSDSFGTSVALSTLSNDGDVLFVGAPNWEGAAGTNRGGVYVYDWSGTAWSQRGSVLEAPDAADSDGFGHSISVAPTASITLVVGALNWEGATGTNRGGVYIFTESGLSWAQQGSVLAPSDAADNDNFGTAVAISGDGLVLAVSTEKTFALGEVYIFDRSSTSSTTWIQRGSNVRVADESIGLGALSTNFGSGLSLNYRGSLLIVGSTAYDSTQGGVYTYTLTGDLPITADNVSGSGLVDSSGGAILRTSGIDRVTFQSSGNVVFSNSADLVFSTNAGIYANGSLGTAGQILSSNGTTVYWASPTDNNTTYDLAAVANVAVNEGLIRLTSSSNANDDVKVSGANGIVVSSNATHVILTNQIIAGSGLTGATANTIAVVANSGIIANSTGVFVNPNSGIIANSTGVFVNPNSGIIANSTGVFVNSNTGIVANSTGVFVNASYIATIASNTASFANASSTNTFTVGTATYFVSNGNVGIANASPTDKLSVNGTTFLQANVTLNSALIANGGAGSAGQVLTSNGTSTYWATASAGVNTSAQYTWTNTHTHATGLTLNNDVKLSFKTVNTAAAVSFRQQGDDNFVFYSTNTAYGERPIFSIFANSVTSDFQIQVPLRLNSGLIANASTGSAGQILTSNGSATYWSTLATGGIAPTTVIVTNTAFTAVKDFRYFLTNTSPTTATLPAAPTLGDTVYIVVTNSLANNVVARNGNKIMSLDEDLTLDVSYYSIGLTYLDTTRGWVIV